MFSPTAQKCSVASASAFQDRRARDAESHLIDCAVLCEPSDCSPRLPRAPLDCPSLPLPVRAPASVRQGKASTLHLSGKGWMKCPKREHIDAGGTPFMSRTKLSSTFHSRIASFSRPHPLPFLVVRKALALMHVRKALVLSSTSQLCVTLA